MLQGVAGGVANFLQPTMTSNTGSTCVLQGVAGGAAKFFATNYDYSNTCSSHMLQDVAGGAADFLQPSKTSNTGL